MKLAELMKQNWIEHILKVMSLENYLQGELKKPQEAQLKNK